MSEAGSVGMASDGEISQGFGVVTSVLLASCGLNLGSEIKTSTFAISGSAEASNAMAGNAKGSVAGSYSETGQTASFEQHLWPATSGGPATANVPIAFQFASFINGNQLIVGWITDVSDIEIELADDHGGTYIVDAKASYTSAGQSQAVSASVSGGRTTTMLALDPPTPPTSWPSSASRTAATTASAGRPRSARSPTARSPSTCTASGRGRRRRKSATPTNWGSRRGRRGRGPLAGSASRPRWNAAPDGTGACAPGSR